MAIHDLSLCKKFILDSLASNNNNRKNTIAFSYRYFCTKHTSIDEIGPLAEALFKLISENDFSVKKSALGSLNTLVYNVPKSIQYANSNFMNALADLCKYKQELVKEIILGPIKHLIDEGLPLRRSAFGFIDTSLEYLLEKVDYGFIVNLIMMGISNI